MLGDFGDFVSRLKFTPAGVVRSVVADPKKAVENLAKCNPASRLPSEADPREKITPEQALTDALFVSDRLSELLTGEDPVGTAKSGELLPTSRSRIVTCTKCSPSDGVSIGRSGCWLG
jgi:hypothetical protein